jgi:DNA polymerase-1
MSQFKEERTALIDGDIIVYQCAASVESTQGDAMELFEKVTGMLEEWTRRAFCTKAIVCLSCNREDNYRREYWPVYKEHRSKKEPPAFLGQAREMITDEAKTMERPRLEADDLMGLLATNGKVNNPVIVSIDKDLESVPGWVFNPGKMDFPIRIPVSEADTLFHVQWMTGDSSDNYPGLYRVGEVGAMKKLHAAIVEGVSPEALVISEYYYHNKGYDYDYCLAMARCARILTADHWDAKRKQPVPYTPSDETLQECVALGVPESWLVSAVDG